MLTILNYFSPTTVNFLQASLSNLELCLATLDSWFSDNGLTLDGDKSEAINFGARQKLKTYPPSTIAPPLCIVPPAPAALKGRLLM